MSEHPTLSELFGDVSVRESVHRLTGMHVEWMGDGGNDGAISWSFSRHERGWIICGICPTSRFDIPAGVRSLPSPYRRCAHMLRTGL